MTGLEAAIRNALERAGVSDAATRERIYRSARAALEKGLAQRPDLEPEAADAQRSRFDALVREIEDAEVRREGLAVEPPRRGAAPEPAVDADVPSVDADPVGKQNSTTIADAPDVSVSREGRLGEPTDARETKHAPAEAVSAELKPERTKRGKKAEARTEKQARTARRRRNGSGILSAIFLLVTLVVFGGLVLWLIDASGLLAGNDSGASKQGSFAGFDTRNAEGAGLMAGGGFVGDWIPVFKAGKDQPPVAGSAAKVEPVKDERGQAVRITSATDEPDGRVRIPFPVETLRKMAGKAWVIALNARAVGDTPTQIAIECAFGSLGDCGRRRVDVAVETTDIVFKVDFAKGSAPNEPGYLLVNSDISGKGRSIDLFAVGLHEAD